MTSGRRPTRARTRKASSTASGPWQLPAFLCGLVFAATLLPADLWPGVSERLQWVVLASSLVLGDFVLAVASGDSVVRKYARGLLPVTLAIVAMVVAWLLNPHGQSSALAAISFAVASWGGCVVGRRWAAVFATRSWIDVGLQVFLAGSSISLIGLGLRAGSVSEFHRIALLPWGGSNYVAGVLVVAALIMWGRRDIVPLARAVAIIAAAVAVLTLSRGAFIALGAGLLVLFWNSGLSLLTRLFWRVAALSLVWVGIRGLEAVTQERSTGGYDPSANVDARFTLYRLAWEEFVEHPFAGTGWLGLRELAQFELNFPISYAHNLFLSFLQMGGVLGLFFLVVFSSFAWKCWRCHADLRPALIAGLAISMSDPFVESPVAAFLMWTLLAVGTASAGRVGSVGDAADRDRGSTVSRARPRQSRGGASTLARNVLSE